MGVCIHKYTHVPHVKNIKNLKREILELTDIVNQMDRTDIYLPFYLGKLERINPLLSSSHVFLQNWPHTQSQSKRKDSIHLRSDERIKTDRQRKANSQKCQFLR